MTFGEKVINNTLIKIADKIDENNNSSGKKVNIDNDDECDNQKDEYSIDKNIKNDFSVEKLQNDIALLSSTSFFSKRMGEAFPGIRGIKEFGDVEDCKMRLENLLKYPLGNNYLDHIWWLRGLANFQILQFSLLDNDKVLINNTEIKLKRIVVNRSNSYYKDFVYIEIEPDDATGLNENIINNAKE